MTGERRAQPSLEIASAIRAQIASGELAPGDRVPSARQIVRTYGVAIATATRAVAVLQTEGLVRAVPGVGTIVQASVAPGPPAHAPVRANRRPAGSRSPTDTPLAHEQIVTVAVTIADTEGLDAVSMRRVAAQLGVGVMSLYRHVTDKDDLVLKMTDSVLREWRPPADDDSGWPDRLEAGSWRLWTVFRRHPWAAPALSLTRPQPVAGGLAYGEWVLGTLEITGLEPDEVYDVYVTLFAYIRGAAVNLEAEASAEAVSGISSEQFIAAQAEQRQRLVAGGEFPRFQRLVTSEYDFDLDRLFQRGLRYLLAGVATSLESTD